MRKDTIRASLNRTFRSGFIGDLCGAFGSSLQPAFLLNADECNEDDDDTGVASGVTLIMSVVGQHISSFWYTKSGVRSFMSFARVVGSLGCFGENTVERVLCFLHSAKKTKRKRLTVACLGWRGRLGSLCQINRFTSYSLCVFSN